MLSPACFRIKSDQIFSSNGQAATDESFACETFCLQIRSDCRVDLVFIGRGVEARAFAAPHV